MNFKELTSNININLTDKMEELFESYYSFLVYYNEFVNLTAITEHDEVYIKHFYDSLLMSKAIDLSGKKIIDVGAGAGFPSVPLAIVNKDLDVTIIDALNKRIVFLNELIKKLELKNVKAIHARAEEYALDYKESYDIATARAVAKLQILLELCLPLVKKGGYFIALKGKDYIEELKEAENALKVLGGRVVKTLEFNLPNDLGQRYILVIEKIKECPKAYPRQFAKIKKNPL
jgi:16S rRNA (guanine527-N7)-methyltransferase